MQFIFYDGISPFIIDVHVLASFITENISAQRNTFRRKRNVARGISARMSDISSIITARCMPKNGIT